MFITILTYTYTTILSISPFSMVTACPTFTEGRQWDTSGAAAKIHAIFVK